MAKPFTDAERKILAQIDLLSDPIGPDIRQCIALELRRAIDELGDKVTVEEVHAISLEITMKWACRAARSYCWGWIIGTARDPRDTITRVDGLAERVLELEDVQVQAQKNSQQISALSSKVGALEKRAGGNERHR